MTERDEKQAIEEMAEAIFQNCNCGLFFSEAEKIARFAVEEKGYRKQSVGEWVETDYKTVEHGFVERRGKAWLCTNCRHVSKEFNPNMNYCPNCGAKMKGGAE